MQGRTSTNTNQSKLIPSKISTIRNQCNSDCSTNSSNPHRWFSEPFDFTFLVLLPLLVLSLIDSENFRSLNFGFPSALVVVPFIVLRFFYFRLLFCHLKSLAGKVFHKVRGFPHGRVCFQEKNVSRPVPEKKLSSGIVRARNSDLSEEYFSCLSRKDLNFSSMLAESGVPISESSSPYVKSPWASNGQLEFEEKNSHKIKQSCESVLLGSIIREQGHIYSLAASENFLYTGSDSKNIRVWKDRKEFSGFKSNSGLVKAIVIAGTKIFTGHQDGKIRVWKLSNKSANVHRRLATLPTMKDFITSSIKPNMNRTGIWLKHLDAISCLCLNEDKTLLYSASWDKTFKIWRVSDFKCLESVKAHEDAVNSVTVGFDGLVFTGSADGTVKVWRREVQGKGTKHFFSQTLLKHDCAVTALAVNPEATVIYSGSSDGLLNFWEREKNLEHGGVLRSHKLAILCLETVANLVFSGSADMSIWVWRRNGSEHSSVSVLSGHTGPVKCLAVEQDRETPEKAWILYSGSLDKSVKMWRVTDQPTTSALSLPPVESSQRSPLLMTEPSFSVQGRISATKEA